MYKQFESKIIVGINDNKRFFSCADDCKHIGVSETGVTYCKYWSHTILKKSNRLIPLDDCVMSTLFPDYNIYDTKREEKNEM